ncbi:hypothetical protein GCK72_003846 [Caenorhabditis remanei]|uniref:F-box associated domain-containing protein n=1 Tax=Caenorhabditis remanei TaxID=31234 RepID=A0A6A5H7U2_CAERE|nr:hypothetical protein GCK72_003846 [Caenorhabditis remanei]KAF1763900.1 hypothetical protein GCK72_003846 [Caenorhabditis remanei]
MRTMSIQNVFFHPIIRNCEAVIIIGGKEISSEDLNFILDTASCLRHLRIEDTSTPPYGYFHEKIFELKTFECHTYDWMCIESLFTLKNHGKLSIGKNRFSYADLNRFLPHWVHSEVDMFDRYLHIDMEEDIPEDELFDGIIRLNSNRFGLPAYLIKADSNHQQRRKLILCIWYQMKTLKLSAWLPNDRWPIEIKGEKTFQGEYDALRAVEKRMELEQILKENRDEEILNQIRELNEQLEELQAEFEFTITECIEF